MRREDARDGHPRSPKRDDKKETAAPAISFTETINVDPDRRGDRGADACYRAGGGVAVLTHSE